MPDILQLTYVSTASYPPTAENCADILTTSRRNNSQFDITGVLLHNSTHFLQTIEGPEPILRILYDRISKDPLHHTLNIINESTLQHRQFGGWAMAYDDGKGSRVLRDQIDLLLERCGPPFMAQFAATPPQTKHSGPTAY